MCTPEIEIIANSVIKFFSIEGAVNFASTSTLFLKFSAFLTALKVVFPKETSNFALGRPIQIIDLESAESNKIYCESDYFTKLRLMLEAQTNNPLLAYRHLRCYYDSSNDQINKELLNKETSVIAKAGVLDDTEDHWEKSLAVISSNMDCLEEDQKKHLRELIYSPSNISDIFHYLDDRYGHERIRSLLSPDDGSSVLRRSNITNEDSRFMNKSLCDEIKSYSKCAKENTELLTRLMRYRSILNVIKVNNLVGDTTSNIDLRIKGNVTIISNDEIDGFNTYGSTQYKRVSLGTFLPHESKYIFIKSQGNPLKENTITVTSPWYTKVDTKSAKNILALSFLVTLLITILSIYNLPG